MFNVYLAMALAGTFGAVALGSWWFSITVLRRRDGAQLLEARLGRIPQPVDLREKELSASVMERVLLPFLGKISVAGRRFTPVGMRQRLQRRLLLAGSPSRWDVEKLAALKMVGVVGSLLFLLAMPFTQSSAPRAQYLFFVALVGCVGFFGIDAVLARKGRERQEAIQNALPDTMDLLTISVEAGLSFDAALTQVIENVKGPLSDEIGRMLQEMRLGVARVDAFRHLAERTEVDELRSFVVAMIQADTFGVSVSKVLRTQSRELRTKRRQRAEEKAMRVPIKILFPLVFCVMPALFVVILGPGVIRIYTSLLGS